MFFVFSEATLWAFSSHLVEFLNYVIHCPGHRIVFSYALSDGATVSALVPMFSSSV